MNANEMINMLRNNFQAILRVADMNRDGTIDRAELANLLVTRCCVNPCVAQNMVAEIFCKLDRNQDGRLTFQEVQGNCECMVNYVQNITLCCPQNGAQFCHYCPRRVTLAWTPVAIACSYQVEVKWEFGCQWHPLPVAPVTYPSCFLEIPGPGNVQWRVIGCNAQGVKCAESKDTWSFCFRV